MSCLVSAARYRSHLLTPSCSSANPKDLIPILESSKETTLTLAAAHALVLLDGGVVGDPMEKTTLDALNWKLSAGDIITPQEKDASHSALISIRRRFQFSSSLKRMSTVSIVADPSGSGRRTLIGVKGAPETLRGMYVNVPEHYEDTYKWFTRRGSRVLALGYKYMDNVSSPDQVSPIVSLT